MATALPGVTPVGFAAIVSSPGLPARVLLVLLGWAFLVAGRYLWSCYDGLLGGCLGLALAAALLPPSSGPWVGGAVLLGAFLIGTGLALLRFSIIALPLGLLTGLLLVDLVGPLTGRAPPLPAQIAGGLFGTVGVFALRSSVAEAAIVLCGSYLLATGCGAGTEVLVVIAAGVAAYFLQRDLSIPGVDEELHGERVSPPEAIPALLDEVRTLRVTGRFFLLRAASGLVAVGNDLLFRTLLRAAARRALRVEVADRGAARELRRLSDRAARIVRRDRRRGPGAARVHSLPGRLADLRELWRIHRRRARLRRFIARRALSHPGDDPGLRRLARGRSWRRKLESDLREKAGGVRERLENGPARARVGARLVDGAFRRPHAPLLALLVPLLLATLGAIR